MKQRRPKPWFVRPSLALAGLAILTLGLGPISKGGLFYQTYWGGAAFAPILVLIGGLVIYMATFGWSRLERRDATEADERHKRS